MLCSMRLFRGSNLSDYRINVVIESRAMVGWRLSKKPLASQILLWAVSSPKCKKCSVMLLKVERIRCKQLSGALEAERFARPSV